MQDAAPSHVMNTIEEEVGEDAIQETVEIDLDDEPGHHDLL